MVQTLTEKLSERANEESRSLHFDGEISVRPYSKTPHFEAYTNMQTKETCIKHNPEYETVDGRSEGVVSDIVAHEFDHHGDGSYFLGCPRTLDLCVEKIIEPMGEVLFKRGYSAEDIKYIENTFADSLLHCDLGRERSLEGIVDFFEDIGESSGFSEYYTAHVMLNMYLFGDKSQEGRVERFYEDSEVEIVKDEKVTAEEVVKSFLEKSGLRDLRQEDMKDYVRGRKFKDRGEVGTQKHMKMTGSRVRNYLMNEYNWPKLSRIYAEEFSKLMNPNYARGILNHSGAGTKGRETEGQNPEGEGNEFDREREGKEYKMKRIRKAHEKGEKTPSWMKDTPKRSFETLDLLYQSLARSLRIKAESYTQQQNMPVCYYGQRPFDPDKDDFRHITLGFDENGKIEVKKKRFHHDIPIPVKIAQKGFPTARFVLMDTSKSMKLDPEGGNNVGNTGIIPEGDNSRIHYARLGWYGFLEYLKENHLLQQTGIELGNFSDETRIGKGLIEAKKNALSPQWGNTSLDMDSVSHIFSGRENLIFTISDGDIQNWDKIKERFLDKAKDHYYFHMQIGGETDVTRDLETAGLKVEQIKGDKDLANKVIDLTDTLLRRPKK